MWVPYIWTTSKDVQKISSLLIQRLQVGCVKVKQVEKKGDWMVDVLHEHD